MVLDHVAQRPGRVVEAAAIVDAEGLRHGDLDGADIVAVPQRLEYRIGEPRVEDVLHRLLAHVMVDTEDRPFGEMLAQGLIQRPGRLEVVAERLFDDEAGVLVETVRGERRSRPRRTATGGIAR